MRDLRARPGRRRTAGSSSAAGSLPCGRHTRRRRALCGGRSEPGAEEKADPGAAVYFKLKGQPRCLACDKWWRLAENIAALAAHVDAVRRIDRYGVGTLEQAFAGYAAIAPSAVDWWLVLGVAQTATLAEVEDAFRTLARKHHPDAGGTHDDMARISEAREIARKAVTR